GPAVLIADVLDRSRAHRHDRRALRGQQVLALMRVAVALRAESVVGSAVAERPLEREEVAADLDLDDAAEVRRRPQQPPGRVTAGYPDAQHALGQRRVGKLGQVHALRRARWAPA